MVVEHFSWYSGFLGFLNFFHFPLVDNVPPAGTFSDYFAAWVGISGNGSIPNPNTYYEFLIQFSPKIYYPGPTPVASRMQVYSPSHQHITAAGI